VTIAPLTVVVADANGKSIGKPLRGTGANVNGCPGGKDLYSARGDKLRLIYGASTTLIGKLTIPQPDASPPKFVPPLQFTVRDQCGFLVSGSVDRCATTRSGSSVLMKCSGS
jgi:hypothetical protein